MNDWASSVDADRVLMGSQKSLSESQLPHLETFSKAAELCSFTAAGKVLGLTQAAVSQRIHVLERMLGKGLFERKGTRILLTEAGQQLYEYAQRILALHHEAFEAITDRKTLITGELLLAASSIPGEHLLPDLLSAFRKQYPRIRVRAAVLDSLAVSSEVEHGNVHLGLVGRKVGSPNLEFRPFASDELVLIVPAKNPWTQRRRVSFDQFAREPLVMREPGSGSRWCFEQAISASGKSLADVDIILELGSNEAIKEAVIKGLGVAILSSMAVKKELASGQLRSLKVIGLSLERTMSVVWDARRVLPAPARIFLQFLESTSKQHWAR